MTFNIETLTTRSYSGKIGCMCGCLGSYSDTPRARNMAFNYIVKNRQKATLFTWNTSRDGDAGCMSVDINGRTRALYLTPEGVALAQSLGLGNDE